MVGGKCIAMATSCTLHISSNLAYEQHGTVRFTADAQSAEVMKRNSTVLVLNTESSLSELSSKINGNTSGKPQAFKLPKVVALRKRKRTLTLWDS